MAKLALSQSCLVVLHIQRCAPQQDPIGSCSGRLLARLQLHNSKSSPLYNVLTPYIFRCKEISDSVRNSAALVLV